MVSKSCPPPQPSLPPKKNEEKYKHHPFSLVRWNCKNVEWPRLVKTPTRNGDLWSQCPPLDVPMQKLDCLPPGWKQTTSRFKTTPIHPGRLTWNLKMMVWFRCFSFSIGWFLGSMLIFQGVTYGHFFRDSLAKYGQIMIYQKPCRLPLFPLRMVMLLCLMSLQQSGVLTSSLSPPNGKIKRPASICGGQTGWSWGSWYWAVSTSQGCHVCPSTSTCNPILVDWKTHLQNTKWSWTRWSISHTK